MPYKDPEKQRLAQKTSQVRLRSVQRERDRIRKEENKNKIRELKESTPCADCKLNYPYYVMQFDHVTGVKVGGIAEFVANRQFKKAWEEIEKCEIVCSNCHAIRTFSRQPSGPAHPRWMG